MGQTHPVDQEQYELLDEDDYLHIHERVNRIRNPVAYCGVVDQEHKHSNITPADKPFPKFCPECGKPYCPYCLMLRFAARGI